MNALISGFQRLARATRRNGPKVLALAPLYATSLGRRTVTGVAGVIRWFSLTARIRFIRSRINGVAIHVDPTDLWTNRFLLLSWQYDKHDLEVTRRKVPRDYTFFDIGANFGIWAFSLADHFERIHAFEPNPRCVTCLQRTKAREEVVNVTVVDAGLSDENGRATFFPAEGHQGDGRIYDPADKRVAGKSIQLRTLDSYLDDLNEHPEAAFIKIDVQGAEPKVLRGMRRSVARMKNAILHMEIQEDILREAHESATDLVDILQELGFQPVLDEEDFAPGRWSDFQVRHQTRDYWFIRHQATVPSVTPLNSQGS